MEFGITEKDIIKMENCAVLGKMEHEPMPNRSKIDDKFNANIVYSYFQFYFYNN